MTEKKSNELFGKKPSGAAYKKSRKKKEDEDNALLGSIPKLSAFGFTKNNEESPASANSATEELNVPCLVQAATTDLSKGGHPAEESGPSADGQQNQEEEENDEDAETDGGKEQIRERSNDAGQWGILTKEDIDYWVKRGASDCQHHQSDFSKSSRQYETQNRSFSRAFLYRKLKSNEMVLREWLLYSPSTGKVFCFPCLLFGSSKTNVFGSVASGFNDWKHAETKLSYHEQHKGHREAILLLVTRQSATRKIDQEAAKLWDEEREYWKKLLRIVVRVVMHLAGRGLPFRGKNALVGSPNNGNFLGTLDLIADFDPFMRNHLDQYGNKGSGRASYLSPTIYEELIQLMGDKVLALILDELRQGKYFSICVDSTPDISHLDQLSFVVRYVDKQSHEVKERFLQFLDIASHGSESLSNDILSLLEKHRIDIENARGQSYDNASNMSGRYRGVQARIRAVNPLAIYIPCAAHSLNLAGVCAAECCLDATRYFGIMQQLFNFFSGSTHRWSVLISHLGHKNVVKRLSDTRWSARADATKALANGYVEIQAALKTIAEDAEQTKETTAEAAALLDHLDFLETRIMTTLWNTVMERFNRVNRSLQSENLDLGSAVLMLQSLQDFVNEQRNTFQDLEKEAKILLPNGRYRNKEHRPAKRKRQFDEGESQEVILTGPDRFRINGFIPIVESLIQAIKTRTEAYHTANDNFGFLNICWILEPKEVEEAAARLQQHYSTDLELAFPKEMSHFSFFIRKYIESKQSEDSLFKLPVSAMYKLIFDLNMESTFPNVEIALRIYLSLMISVAKAERTFSKLKLIKDEKRSRMQQCRLNALSLLSIEHSFLQHVKFDDVIDSFVHAKIRKVLS